VLKFLFRSPVGIPFVESCLQNLPVIMELYTGAERTVLCVVAWTGRGGTIFWPPRSPDLTPLDFSLCVCVCVCVDNLKTKFFFSTFPANWKNYGHG
jgi:hypothetical protein